MNLAIQLAKHLREVHFGDNWTSSNLKDNLTGLTWQQATTQVCTVNSIANLVFHIHYFIRVTIPVLQGESLNAHDKYSFDCPPVQSQDEWDNLFNTAHIDAETFAYLIEKLPEEKLWEDFTDLKYGNYYRNIQGIIEHVHYHLGQIALIKKILFIEK